MAARETATSTATMSPWPRWSGPLHKTTQRQQQQQQHHTGGGSRGSGGGVRALFTPRSSSFFFRFFFFLVAFSCGAWRLRASSSPLSRQAGRHQRRRIMCNYNRQSKTKPFTFNEFLLEKGRLPQGGILMKQMAECSQGQTLTVLLFFFLQSTNNSSVLRSFTCLLTALCVHLGSECVCVIGFCLLTPLTRWKGGGIMSNSTESPFSCVPAAHKK